MKEANQVHNGQFHLYKTLKNVNCTERKQMNVFEGWQWQGDPGLHEETCGSDGYAHYLDFGDGFTGIYIHQNASNYVL